MTYKMIESLYNKDYKMSSILLSPFSKMLSKNFFLNKNK